jgi:anti-sigma B factor antagonist
MAASSSVNAVDFRVDEEHPRPGTTVLSVYGDADLHAAPDLRERLTGVIDAGATTIVVDLSETTFVDSMTLGVLLGGMKRLRARDGRLDLVVPRADIRRIFEITLLDRIFPLHTTRAEALEAVLEHESSGEGGVETGVHG